MFEQMETFFQSGINYCILILEAIGAAIILIYAARALFSMARGKGDSKLFLTEGITTAMNFLLSSEVLKTIIAPDWTAIGMTGAIIVMRASMTVLVHWENKHETHHN